MSPEKVLIRQIKTTSLISPKSPHPGARGLSVSRFWTFGTFRHLSALFGPFGTALSPVQHSLQRSARSGGTAVNHPLLWCNFPQNLAFWSRKGLEHQTITPATVIGDFRHRCFGVTHQKPRLHEEPSENRGDTRKYNPGCTTRPNLRENIPLFIPGIYSGLFWFVPNIPWFHSE